jgi:hypothetical protein
MRNSRPGKSPSSPDRSKNLDRRRGSTVKFVKLKCSSLTKLWLAGAKKPGMPIPLRRIANRDAASGEHYFFLTSQFKLAAKVADNIQYKHTPFRYFVFLPRQ